MPWPIRDLRFTIDAPSNRSYLNWAAKTRSVAWKTFAGTHLNRGQPNSHP